MTQPNPIPVKNTWKAGQPLPKSREECLLLWASYPDLQAEFGYSLAAFDAFICREVCTS